MASNCDLIGLSAKTNTPLEQNHQIAWFAHADIKPAAMLDKLISMTIGLLCSIANHRSKPNTHEPYPTYRPITFIQFNQNMAIIASGQSEARWAHS